MKKFYTKLLTGLLSLVVLRAGAQSDSSYFDPTNPTNILAMMMADSLADGSPANTNSGPVPGSPAPSIMTYPTNAVLKWSLALNGDCFTEPAIGPDGTIYVCQHTTQGSLWAINPDSSIKWQWQTNLDAGFGFGIAISVDGTLNVMAWDANGNLGYYGVSPTNGSVIWTYPGFSADEESVPAVAPDGTVYFPNGNTVLAFTNGALKWVYPTNNVPVDGPFGLSFAVVGPDCTLYLPGFEDNNLYALNPNGSLQWMINGFWVPEDTSLVLGSDGTIYCVTAGTNSNPYYLAALNADGTVKWECASPPNTIFEFSPEIGPDGTIYVEAENQSQTWDVPYTDLLCALTPSGTVKWTFPLSELQPSSGRNNLLHGTTCAIACDGEIYATTTDGTLYSLAPNGTMNWSTNVGVTGLKAPIIGPDGSVYVASYDSPILFAFSGSAAVACGQWPQCRLNARHTAAFAAAKLSSPTKQTKGFAFVVSGVSNMPVCSCASSDLVTWTNLGQIVLTNGTARFVDTQSSNFPNRFYRVLPQ